MKNTLSIGRRNILSDYNDFTMYNDGYIQWNERIHDMPS
jgi:hypothetical protein